MKVCTDACLFGAVVAHEISNRHFTNALDIGTGTGLLPLLLAQKNKELHIDAIEIDLEAHKQSAANFEISAWHKNINAVWADINKYKTSTAYHLIISNPPFFENDLPSENEKKNAAKHDTTLTLSQLLKAAFSLLAENGLFAVLLPYHRCNDFEALCHAEAFFIQKKIQVRQSDAHGFFRVIYFAGKEQTACTEAEIAIKNKENNYTEAFTGLLKDYYLYL